MQLWLMVTSFLAIVVGDVSHNLLRQKIDDIITTTTSPPAHPYAFSYTAGRFPGHVDRIHTEVSDGSGTVRGSFSYIDPRNEIQKVDYIANKYGFYPKLNSEPKQSEAVKKATERHIALYNKTVESHRNYKPEFIDSVIPLDTRAVADAKTKHLNAYQRISEAHARIAAEREIERLAFEATSEINQLEERHDDHLIN